MERYEDRTQNSCLLEVMRDQTRLLESYYSAIEHKNVDEDAKKKLEDAATDLKFGMVSIQSLVGADDKPAKSEEKKPEEPSRDEPGAIEIAFLSGLEDAESKK